LIGYLDGSLDGLGEDQSSSVFVSDSNSTVRDITLRVAAGKTSFVLGSNYFGNPKLLRTISGILRVRSGQFGCKVWNITRLMSPEIAMAKIGHVYEGPHVFPTLNFHDVVLLKAHQRRDWGLQ
jgi:ABC-type branched-subunit amino acid transport system ATPase component